MGWVAVEEEMFAMMAWFADCESPLFLFLFLFLFFPLGVVGDARVWWWWVVVSFTLTVRRDGRK